MYPSVEHAFQAAKTSNVDTKRVFQVAPSPELAKKLGKHVKIRDDWECCKVDMMYSLLRSKFVNNPELAYRLVCTNDSTLVEGNSWGDRFWGVCKGQGENHLGQILMSVRSELNAISSCK